MEKSKVITMCGSLRFKDKIMEMSEELELQGNCVLSIIYSTKEDKDSFTYEQMQTLKKMHIMMSDAIFVANVNGYIGTSVSSEIEYAKQLGKEIIYLEPIKDN